VDLADATVIGDSDSDVEAGRAVGANTIKIGADAPSLAEAVRWLLAS
jgi:beta-phosphoglucomutase-like phosphatase (HAD superfamily)